MGNENGKDWVPPSVIAFEGQTEYDRESKTYTAKCGVCGRAYTQKKAWFRSKDATALKLRFNFSYCDKCGKWICEDCFLIDNGNGAAMGICTVCAEKRGITGLTTAQFDEQWPRIQSLIYARRKAIQKAVANEELKMRNEKRAGGRQRGGV